MYPVTVFFASDLLIVGSERASFKYPRAFGTSDNLSVGLASSRSLSMKPSPL